MKKIVFTLLGFLAATLAIGAVDNEFKNILLNVDFNKTSENTYRVNLITQVPYPDEVKIVKKSDYNYYILLAETYSKPTVTTIGGDIDPLQIQLFPYVAQDLNNGYTKISLTTKKPVDFTVSLNAKGASKFPIMDLVKIAKLDNMYAQQKSTVKGGKVLLAQGPTQPEVKPVQVAVKPQTVTKPQAPQEVKPTAPVTIAKAPQAVKPQAQAKPQTATKPQTVAKPEVIAPPRTFNEPKLPAIAKAPQTALTQATPKPQSGTATTQAPADSAKLSQKPTTPAIVPAPKAEQSEIPQKAQQPVAQQPKKPESIENKEEITAKTPESTPNVIPEIAPEAVPEDVADEVVTTQPQQVKEQVKQEPDNMLAKLKKVAKTLKQNPILALVLFGALAVFIGACALMLKNKLEALASMAPDEELEEDEEQALTDEINARKTDYEQKMRNIGYSSIDETQQTQSSTDYPEKDDLSDNSHVGEIFNMMIAPAAENESEIPETETPQMSAPEPDIARGEEETKEEVIDIAQTTEVIETVEIAQTSEAVEVFETTEIAEEFETISLDEIQIPIVDEAADNAHTQAMQDIQAQSADDFRAQMIASAQEQMDAETPPEVEATEETVTEIAANTEYTQTQEAQHSIEIEDDEDEIAQPMTLSFGTPEINENVFNFTYDASNSQETPEENPTNDPTAYVDKNEQKLLSRAERAKIISSARVENDRGFFLADYKGTKALVGYIADDIFVIHSFKNQEIKDTKINFRLSETNSDGDFYLVKVNGTTLLVKSAKREMSLSQYFTP